MIIAAHSNKDSYSIPASLAGVFGVAADDTMYDDIYEVVADSAPLYCVKNNIRKYKLPFCLRRGTGGGAGYP